MTNAIAALIVATNLLQLSPMDVTISAPYYGVDVECYSLFIPTNAVTVTVLTNVVKWSNGVQLGRTDGGGYVTDGMGNATPLWGWTLTPETERTETTIVMERRVLRFKWLDVWREVTSEKELSRTVKRWAKKEQWEAVP